MKNIKIISQMVILFAFLLVSSTITAQVTKEEGMAKAVFKTTQDGDVEAFLSYCISEDRKTEMLNGITGNSEMEKDIKQDLENENVEILRDQMKTNFNAFLDELKKEDFSHKDIAYKEFQGIDHQFDLKNLRCYDIKYEVVINETNYRFEINLYEIKGDVFLFGFRKIN